MRNRGKSTKQTILVLAILRSVPQQRELSFPLTVRLRLSAAARQSTPGPGRLGHQETHALPRSVRCPTVSIYSAAQMLCLPRNRRGGARVQNTMRDPLEGKQG